MGLTLHAFVHEKTDAQQLRDLMTTVNNLSYWSKQMHQAYPDLPDPDAVPLEAINADQSVANASPTNQVNPSVAQAAQNATDARLDTLITLMTQMAQGQSGTLQPTPGIGSAPPSNQFLPTAEANAAPVTGLRFPGQ